MTARVQDRTRQLELLVVSFVMLFLEISLIRWISTEIRIFAYVNNLVLLACFLGIGIGCYYAKKRASLTMCLLGLAALVALIISPLMVPVGDRSIHLFKDTPTLLSAFTDTMIWYQEAPTALLLKSVAGLTATLVIFVLIVVTFVPLGQMLGKLLDDSMNRIFAYSLNVVASLVGIWCFNLLSLMSQPPFVWFAIVLLLLVVLARLVRVRSGMFATLAFVFAGLLVVMAVRPLVTREIVLWSPYQKLQVRPLLPLEMRRGYQIAVNGVRYMLMLNLSDVFMDAWPTVYDPALRRFSHYNLPYLFKRQPEEVLIVGAGAGNDAAGAVRNGAHHVTAVEIDPGIYRLGQALHPEAPYANPKVDVVIDDARSFFKKTTTRYDLISFGLLDAHTQSSSYNNMRIDHYVYTEGSFREVRRLLQPDGVLTVIFEVSRQWVGDRIAGLLQKTFGHNPVAFVTRSGSELLGSGGVMFVISEDMTHIHEAIAGDAALRDLIQRGRFRQGQPVKLTTDDWPYLYLEKPTIPMLHLCFSGLLLLMFVAAKRFVLARHQRLNWHFFFLGAAFLLLEFQNISKTTLLFGSTWLVNSFIISAILLLILLANFIAAKWKAVNLNAVYAGLLLSLVVSFVVPLDVFSALPYTLRVIAASATLNLPILFAGIVFITSFKTTRHADVAFGSNLLGAGVGGLMESASFVTGIHPLLVLVGGLYLASWLTLRQARA